MENVSTDCLGHNSYNMSQEAKKSNSEFLDISSQKTAASGQMRKHSTYDLDFTSEEMLAHELLLLEETPSKKSRHLTAELNDDFFDLAQAPTTSCTPEEESPERKDLQFSMSKKQLNF
jgi:hypothetical protein